MVVRLCQVQVTKTAHTTRSHRENPASPPPAKLRNQLPEHPAMDDVWMFISNKRQ